VDGSARFLNKGYRITLPVAISGEPRTGDPKITLAHPKILKIP
jgi:hypothetical protein